MEPPAKYLSADERRAATVDAVVRLAASGNPGDISTTAIARHMGVTQGALFKHFPNKEAILAAVMDSVAQQLLARVDQAAQGLASPLAALEAMFLAHVDFVVEHPGVPRMLFGELQRAEMSAPKRMVQALLRQYRERLLRLVRAGQAQGEIGAQVDAEAAVLLFIGQLQGLVMQSLLAGDVARMRQNAQALFVLYRSALEVRP